MNKLAIIPLAGILAGCSVSDKIGNPVPFGTTKYGEKATLYTLAGKGGLEMQ